MSDKKETFEETICEQTMATRMSKLQAEYNIAQKVIKELKEENKRLLECNKEFQNRAVYWMNEHDKIKNKYEPEILTIGEE